MTTLFDILKNTYLSLGHLEQSVATDGSTTTVVDTKLTDYGDDDLVNGTVFITRDAGGAGAAPEGEASRISSNSQATQTITVDTAFSAAVAAGDVFGLASSVYPLYTLIELVNRALSNLGTIQLIDTSLTTVSSQVEYDLPVTLKHKPPVRVQTSSDNNIWTDITNWYAVPASPGSTGLLVFNAEPASGYTLKLWYETEHPRLALMTDLLSETIHSEYAVALVVEKAIQWQLDRQAGKDTYLLQRWNKATMDVDEVRTRLAPKKISGVKYLPQPAKRVR